MWRISILVCVFCIVSIWSLELPCERNFPGDRCVFDEECEGHQTKCVLNVCTCPPDYEDYLFNTTSTRGCRPAPHTVNATCQKTCRAPLVCQNGVCVCWKAKQVGNDCFLECPSGQTAVGQTCEPIPQKLGGQCLTDPDCTGSFTMCDKGKCVCQSGIKQTNGACNPTCPDGSSPGAACRLRHLEDRKLRDNVEDMDTCPCGQRCVTYGKPDIGHCCKIYCPYGDADLTKSCKLSDLTQKSNRACPTQSTHYCQIVENNGARDQLCCPRPCRDPAPVYKDGQCWPFAHLDDPCGSDDDCEGGVAMQCTNERCQCNQGFTRSDTGTFPTCLRSDCDKSEVVVQNQCFPKSAYDKECIDSAQCPTSMMCSDGVCQCKCGYAYAAPLGTCYNPTDPLNVNPLLCNLQSVFKKVDPKCALAAVGATSG